MTLDVLNSVVINRPVEAVSRYAADPDNAPLWYENIKSVEWRTPRPAHVGARIDFVAHFLGRRLSYTYEIVEFIPGKRLVITVPNGDNLRVGGRERRHPHDAAKSWDAERILSIPDPSDVVFRRQGEQERLGATQGAP